MTNKECLEKARGYIARGWTQQKYARDATGEFVAASHPSATCWCIKGALYASVSDVENGIDLVYECSELLTDAADMRRCRTNMLAVWNDAKGRTQAQVLALFDFVISKA